MGDPLQFEVDRTENQVGESDTEIDSFAKVNHGQKERFDCRR